MFWEFIFFVSSSHALQQTLNGPTCTNHENSRTIRISLNKTRHPTCVWMDALSAWIEVNRTSKAAQMDLTHTVTVSQGKRILHINGVTQALRYEEVDDKLKFHQICGKNICRHEQRSHGTENQVGETMGVMRSEMGTMHFFLNGEDQGPVMSNWLQTNAILEIEEQEC